MNENENANVIWLASYPKSGNTWLKNIIHAMMKTDMELMEAIPSLHKTMPDAPLLDLMGTKTKLVKTHCHAFSPRLKPVQDKMIGVITIHRHPMDVMLSALNYARWKGKSGWFEDNAIKTVDDIIASGEIGYYVERFIETDGCAEYLGMSGAWSEFIPQWSYGADVGNVPHLRMCYELLAQKPQQEMERLRRFLALPEFDYEKLAAQVEGNTALNGGFYWRKRAYNFRGLVPTPLIHRFEKHYARVLGELGYETT